MKRSDYLVEDLSKHPRTLSGIEAAQRGKARLLTVEDALNEMRRKESGLNKFGKTSQSVFFQKQSVIKSLNSRAEIEEKMIQQCFSLDGSAGIVPFYSFKGRLALQNLKLSLNELVPANRRYPLNTMTTVEGHYFYNALKDDQKKVLFRQTYERWLANPEANKQSFEKKQNDYIYFSKIKFSFPSSGQFPPFIASFEEVIKLIDSGNLDRDFSTQIMESGEVIPFNNILSLKLSKMVRNTILKKLICIITTC